MTGGRDRGQAGAGVGSGGPVFLQRVGRSRGRRVFQFHLHLCVGFVWMAAIACKPAEARAEPPPPRSLTESVKNRKNALRRARFRADPVFEPPKSPLCLCH